MAACHSEIYLPSVSLRANAVTPPEKELVIALSLIPVESGAARRARELIASGIDWDGVFELASLWQIDAVVLGNLRMEFQDAIPLDILRDIAEREKNARAHALSRTLLSVELVKTLASHGVPSLVFKGPALAIAAYGDCSRRAFGDLDLLIHREHLATAVHILVERGFVASFRQDMVGSLIEAQHALELADSTIKVELHWTLLSRFLRFDLAAEELWERAVRIQCLDFDLPVLAPTHHFLYLCAHGAKHEWMHFRWLADVAQLARQFPDQEAQEVLAIAQRTNSRRILALALRLVGEVFPEEDVRFPRAAFRSKRETDKLVALVKARLGLGADPGGNLLSSQLARIHPYTATLLFWIRSRERVGDKVASVARLVFGRTSP